MKPEDLGDRKETSLQKPNPLQPLGKAVLQYNIIRLHIFLCKDFRKNVENTEKI